MIKKTLKVYVWKEFNTDYYHGLAVAIANNEEEARNLVIEYHEYNPGIWGPLEIHELKPQAYTVSGGG